MESNLCDSFHYAHNRGSFWLSLTQIQKPSEYGEIILQLNREGNKLDEESRVINENIAKYNRQISSYKREHFPNSSYTQQIEKYGYPIQMNPYTWVYLF